MTSAQGASGARFMYIFGAVILVAVGGWYAFSAIDRMSLATHEARAAVTDKQHRPAGTTYTRTVINNRTVTLPQATAESWVLGLSLDGRDAYGFAARELYDAVNVGDSVQVSYQRRRITGGVQVVDVRR
jgi:hypothetical protein